MEDKLPALASAIGLMAEFVFAVFAARLIARRASGSRTVQQALIMVLSVAIFLLLFTAVQGWRSR